MGQIDCVARAKAIDPDFWRLHAAWRFTEDQFNAQVRGGCEEWNETAQTADTARRAMFAQPVRSASALCAKLEAMREGGGGSVADVVLSDSYTVLDVVRWDCERLAKVEIFEGEALGG